jgi:hypothetical protein
MRVHLGFRQTHVIVLLPRKHQFKICDKCVYHWDHAHPLGDLDAIRGRQWRTPQLRKGSQIAPKGVADLLLEGRGHRRWPLAAAQGSRPCGAAEPPTRLSFLRNKKCAQIMLCKEKHYTRGMFCLIRVNSRNLRPIGRTLSAPAGNSLRSAERTLQSIELVCEYAPDWRGDAERGVSRRLSPIYVRPLFAVFRRTSCPANRASRGGCPHGAAGLCSLHSPPILSRNPPIRTAF